MFQITDENKHIMTAILQKAWKDGKIQKEVTVVRNGKTFTRKQWVLAPVAPTTDNNTSKPIVSDGALYTILEHVSKERNDATFALFKTLDTNALARACAVLYDNDPKFLGKLKQILKNDPATFKEELFKDIHKFKKEGNNFSSLKDTDAKWRKNVSNFEKDINLVFSNANKLNLVKFKNDWQKNDKDLTIKRTPNEFMGNVVSSPSKSKERQSYVEYAKEILSDPTYSWIKPKDKLDTTDRGIRVANDILFKAFHTSKDTLKAIPSVKKYSSVGQCRNFTELSAYMLSRYNVGMEETLRMNNFEQVSRACAGVEVILIDFPQVQSFITNLTGREKSKNAYMSASCMSGEINFNGKHFSKSKFNKVFTYKAGAHETGHLLEFFLTEQTNVQANKKKHLWNQIRKKGSIGDKIIDTAWKSLKKKQPNLFRTKREAREDISHYACKNYCEGFAEGIGHSAYDNSHPLAEEIYTAAQVLYKQLMINKK